MATTQTTSSNYAGKDAGKIWGKAFKKADTLANDLISFYQNVNYKLNMRLIQFADGTKVYQCIDSGAFSTVADGSVTMSEKVLEPIKLMLPLDICVEEYRQTWSEDLIGESAHNPNVPADIDEAIRFEALKSTAQRTDRVIWTGDNSSNANEWDGFITLWTADGNIIKANNGITPTGAPFDTSNVLTNFAKVSSAIPVALRRKELTWVISPDVADIYIQYLISQGAANGLGGNANTQLVYGRYNLNVVNGLPDNTVAVYEKENLAFGTGLLGDHNEIKSRYDDFRGKLELIMVYNGGVQYANSDEIVYFDSTTTA